jgi:hypothetical protein
LANDPSLRLSAQRALLGVIVPAIRLIRVSRADNLIRFSVLTAEPLRDDEAEALSIAAAEIIADFSDCTISEEIQVHPGALPDEDVLDAGWVYQRAE